MGRSVSRAVQLTSVVSRLPVTKMRRSVDFYTTLLGFEVISQSEGGADSGNVDPDFVILAQTVDGQSRVELQLVQRAPETRPPSSNESATRASLWCDTDDVAAAHARLASEVEVEWGPEDYPYGRREFGFRDPDGHLIILSQSSHDSPGCG